MYNASNSTPRKGFGQHNTHKCPHCGEEYHYPVKVPFMIECSNCKKAISGDKMIKIEKDNE